MGNQSSGEEHHLPCRRRSMTRPRASRSSFHRDERWEGCRVLRGMLGQGFSWTRTALNLEAWIWALFFRGAVPVAFLWLSLWVWAWSLLGFVARGLWSALPVLFLFCGVRAWKRRETGLC